MEAQKVVGRKVFCQSQDTFGYFTAEISGIYESFYWFEAAQDLADDGLIGG